MRLEDALRLGVEASRAAVRGEEYAQLLADGAARLFSADAGAGITLWLVSDDGVGGQQVTTAGVRRMSAGELATARAAAARHPSLPAMLSGPTAQRVSDTTRMEPFWETDVYEALHGLVGGRFPAAVSLVRSPTLIEFLYVQRQGRDLTDDELACLDALGEPLRAGLAFRHALDRAAALIGRPPGADGPFTAAEADVIALVSRGWTTDRIARSLGLSESGVRHRLRSARDRVGAGSRTELVARWAAARSDP